MDPKKILESILSYLNTPSGQRFVTSVLCVVAGAFVGWLGSRWRRYRLQRKAETGDAREVATIEKIIIVAHDDKRRSLHIRTCGRDAIETIFPNHVARDAFIDRTLATTTTEPLISMDGKLGSYLLQELAIWTCDKVGEANFPRDVWLMTAVCESNDLGGHQSTTILLVRRRDVAHFRDWPLCRNMHVEHGSHAQRILTLLHVAAEFDRQHDTIEQHRAAGKSAAYVETMYILDLGLDTRVADLPLKPAPWDRFAKTLKALHLGTD